MVRVTSTMLSSNYLKNVSRNMRNIQTMQSQLSTGKKISKPSDNPYQASRIIQMYADVSRNEQYNENIADVTNFLDVTDSALLQMSNLYSRVRELMVSAGNAGYGPEQLQSIQDEMKIKVEQLSQILNTSFDGKYIFGGTKVDSKPTIIVDGKLQYADRDAKSIAVFKNAAGELTTSETVNIKVNLTDLDAASGKTVKEKLQEELTTLSTGTLTPDQAARKKELEDMLATPPVKEVYKDLTGKYTSETGGKNSSVDLSSIDKKDLKNRINDLESLATRTPDEEKQLKELKGVYDNLVVYKQIDEEMRIEISQGVSINYNKTASELLEFKDSKDPTRTINVSELFSDIIKNLGEGGDKDKLATQNLHDLDEAISNLLTKSSEVGAMQNRMESAKSQNETENYNLTSILSNVEDIDFTEKMIDFSTLMTVYKASLQISSKILPQTIMDYL